MTIRFACAGFLVLFLVTTASAEEATKASYKAETAEQFAEVTNAVRAGMQPGGHYEYIKETDKAEVDKSLGQMGDLFSKSGTVAGMTEGDKVRLFNLQEKINGVLTKNASDRLICKRDSHVGSSIPVTTCHTYAETVRNARDSQELMRNNAMRQPQTVRDTKDRAG